MHSLNKEFFSELINLTFTKLLYVSSVERNSLPLNYSNSYEFFYSVRDLNFPSKALKF